MADLAHEGNYLVIWVPGETGIADDSAPTVTELGTGVHLEAQITPTGMSREASTDRKDTSKLNSTFTTQSVGRRAFNLQVVAVRETDDAAGVEAALTYKSLGKLAIRDNAPATDPVAAADEFEVYPAQCDQPNKSAPAVNEDQQITYGFAMRAEPTLDAVVAI